MKPDRIVVLLSLLVLSTLPFCKPREYRPDSGISTGEMAKKEANLKARKGEFDKLLLGKWELTAYNCNRAGKSCPDLADKTIITFDAKSRMFTDRYDLKTGKLIEHFEDLYRLAWFQPAGQWIIELNSHHNYGILYEIDAQTMRLTPNAKSFDTFQKID